jgi:hypothetical protein
MAVQIQQPTIDLNNLLKTLNTSYNQVDKDYFDINEYDIGENVSTVTIKITPANGGTIINVDPADRGGHGDLYVVDSAKDLGVEIGQILTMHYLKKGADESTSKARR